MISRFILCFALLGLLVWIPMATPQGFGDAPLLVVGVLFLATLLLVWRRHPTDE
ncbi:hypothetical protein MVG78_18880 [Roseomonas gilardii subsp. gilardii]|uniref:hypothetical protein n=1 Tax=Roseomonas gilardii TaxID=257708 RepID=UPI001FF8CD8A|nr:hypothetical protein [Roseomonas gilardii]UPG72514.1 hypothetical protein MVG78_18880 [Roseomonas gilardii subsp. gilardii]